MPMEANSLGNAVAPMSFGGMDLLVGAVTGKEISGGAGFCGVDTHPLRRTYRIRAPSAWKSYCKYIIVGNLCLTHI
jgi:hypothetical protein